MTDLLELNATAQTVQRDTPAVPHEPPRPVKLLDQVRERIRTLHYSRATEKTYLYWIKFFILQQGKRHPRDMGAAEVEAFLSHLATAREVSAGTQNQAMHAILFLYKQVLGIDLPWLEVVRDVLGHTSVRTTERYAHLAVDRQREALQALSRAVKKSRGVANPV
jgi:integrase